MHRITLSLALAFSVAPAVFAQNDVPVISRDVLFGNPERAQVRLSPDGEHISFLAPRDGVLNVWVGPADDWKQSEPITNDDHRGVRNHFWAFDSEHVVYLQDRGGDEDFHAYSVNVETGEEIDLTPFDGVRAIVQGVSHTHPNTILVGINNRGQGQFHDLYLINVATGDRELLMQNDGYLGFATDDDFRVRFAQRFLPDGSLQLLEVNTDGSVNPEPWDVIPSADAQNTSLAGFSPDGKTAYMLDSRQGDTSGLYAIDLETDKRELIYVNPKADTSGVMAHPVTGKIEAVSSNYLRNEWTFFDDGVQADFERLRTLHDTELAISSRTLADDKWIVTFVDDNGPVRYYEYDRTTKTPTFLFTHRPDLEGLPLAPMHAEVIEARDGLDLVSYLTLPVWADSDGDGRPSEALPTVLLVHGGPWARDSWGYNPYHQWLANRGYAVLSVNYRGSTGFGKSFINAANLQWGKTMHDDLIDAVDWAIDGGIADADKVAIMGGSYGGYATLVGLTFTPDKFAAGVDIVGPSNLITLVNSIPPYWAPAIEIFKKRMGDHTTPEGRRLLRSASPLTHVDEITKPLLIGQGANDPRVKQAEADQIVEAMTERGIPVAYALFPDEGHGFARPENNKAFNAVVEAFLAEHIGGRYEPIGDDFDGSSITVPVGKDQIPGVADELR